MVNVDGFRLTHASEPVALPSQQLVKKLLNNKITAVLDTKKPQTTGWFTMPAEYQKQRLELKQTIATSWPIIEKVSNQLYNLWQTSKQQLIGQQAKVPNNVAVEYYGPQKTKLLLIAMGSIIGELKDLADQTNKQKPNSVAVLKIKLYRPFPENIIKQYLNQADQIIVIDRSPGLGAQPPLFSDIAAINQSVKHNISSLIIGLGGDVDLFELIKIVKNNCQEQY